MNQLLDKTLSQIVTEHHQAARVFEKYGLDFCCKGKRALKTACEEKQIGEQTILNDLANAFGDNETAPDFNSMTLTALSDYIVRVFHSYVKLNSPQIFSYLLRVAGKHGDRYPHMKEVYGIFEQVKDEMEQHMFQEESILFPRIKQLEMPDKNKITDIDALLAPIDLMEAEHDAAGEMMARIRQLTNNYQPPQDACTTHRLTLASLKAYEEDLHNHVHLENNILFPKAIALFKSIQSSALN
jgi:regulator of cell morphogenesis and NO signaling